ncbi:MAG: hypothetical protein ACLVL7_06640 [Anaerotruncus massiliensis (ex Togo et al. 2019)]
MDDLGAGQQLGELVAAVLRRLDDLDADARLLQFRARSWRSGCRGWRCATIFSSPRCLMSAVKS